MRIERCTKLIVLKWTDDRLQKASERQNRQMQAFFGQAKLWAKLRVMQGPKPPEPPLDGPTCAEQSLSFMNNLYTFEMREIHLMRQTNSITFREDTATNSRRLCRGQNH